MWQGPVGYGAVRSDWVECGKVWIPYMTDFPSRRGFLASLAAFALAAPAVIRTPGLLMPVRALAVSSTWYRYGTVMYGSRVVLNPTLVESGREFQFLARLMQNACVPTGSTLHTGTTVYGIGKDYTALYV